jgi:hypothetical protein
MGPACAARRRSDVSTSFQALLSVGDPVLLRNGLTEDKSCPWETGLMRTDAAGTEARDRDLAAVGALIGEPARLAGPEVAAALEALARVARPAAVHSLRQLTCRLLELGWLSRGRGRVLRVADDCDQQLDRWLASA